MDTTAPARAWLWAVAPDDVGAFVGAGTLALARTGRRTLHEIAPGDTVFLYLTGRQEIAGMVEATSRAFDDATVLVPGRHVPHRLRVRPLAMLAPEARLPVGAVEGHLALASAPGGWRAAVARVVVPLGATDARVLGFLVRAREAGSVERALDAFDRLGAMQAEDAAADAAETADEAARDVEDAAADRVEGDAAAPRVVESRRRYAASAPHPHGEAAEALLAALAATGFAYAPWRVAAFLAALRTRPFVLLAGPTGTGKTRLPLLVAEATGAAATLLPVRPDWADGAETMGYTDLGGRFRAGAVLGAARRAALDAARTHLLVLDEMNLARPEHYLADVMSRLEQRRPGASTPPLVPEASDPAWATVGWPPNLALVGTVNVDESTHAFSRKVLDRAFVLELDAPDLGRWQAAGPPVRLAPWPASAFTPRATSLATLGSGTPDGAAEPLSDADAAEVERAVAAAAAADAALGGGQIGYRTRDDLALFCLHARPLAGTFRTGRGERVDPLDVALAMKVLPRLGGSRASVGAALRSLAAWAGDPGPAGDGPRFPLTAARVDRMRERLAADGFTSFWA